MVRTLCRFVLVTLFSPGFAQASSPPRAYSEVVPDAAVTQRGLWTTHQVGERLYFELPESVLGAAMTVWGAVVGSRQQMIRWVRHGDQVLLRSPVTSRHPHPHIWDDRRPATAPIVAAFPVAAVGPEQAPVIDVTRLFVGEENPQWRLSEPRFAHGGGVIEDVRAFPENVVVTAAFTTMDGQAKPTQIR